jgi:hypothetical protein
MNPNVWYAFKEWEAVRSEIEQAARNAGIDMGHTPNYFPHLYKPEYIDEIFKNKNKWVMQLDNMVNSGKAANRQEAEKIMYNLRDKIRTHRSSNLEFGREANLPEYRRDLNAMLDYVGSSAERISYAQQFGANHEKAVDLLTKIAESGFDKGAAEKAFAMASGGVNTSNKTVDTIRAYNVFTKLWLGALTNAAQSTNTATIAGAVRTMKLVPKAMHDQESIDFAIRAGTTVDSAIAKTREGLGLTGGKPSSIGAPFFNTVERFNRTLASIAGRDMARDAAKLTKNGQLKDPKVLLSLGIDPNRVLKNGLSLEDEIKAAQNIVERSQFHVEPQDLPTWASTPLGKLVTQFRTFSYNQTAFMEREILEPALKGNMKPLTRFMLFAGASGAAVSELQDLIRGTDRSDEELAQKILRYYQKAGGVGLLGEVVLGLNPWSRGKISGDQYAEQVTKAVAGPSMSTSFEALGTVPDATRGNLKPAAKFGLKQVPLGSAASNRIFPKSEPSTKQSTTPEYLRRSNNSMPEYLRR